MYGFGPLGARAATERPSADGDIYGQQAWFKDATEPGVNDGTVLNASLLDQGLLTIAIADLVHRQSNILPGQFWSLTDWVWKYAPQFNQTAIPDHAWSRPPWMPPQRVASTSTTMET